MTTSRANLINSISLIVVSLWGYFVVNTDANEWEWTPLIPVFFGVTLFLCNKGLKNEDKVIFLDSTPERQYERTKDSEKRPLLNDGDSLEILKKLYQKRFNFYETVSKIKISMDNLNTEEILKKIIKFLNK